MTSLTSLIHDVQLLCLDAGNTVVFLDHQEVARLLATEQIHTTADALRVAEGKAKQRLEPGAPPLAEAVSPQTIPVGWSRFVRTLLEYAVPLSAAQAHTAVHTLWNAHCELNLWRRVPDGLANALQSLRASGIPVAIVSNSEGHLTELFNAVGLGNSFDLVIDSALVGVEKPDPAIFQLALSHFHVDPKHTLHLGDTVATDILGAHNAGIRAALIDPFGHFEGRLPDVPRVIDVVSVAHALCNARKQLFFSHFRCDIVCPQGN